MTHLSRPVIVLVLGCLAIEANAAAVVDWHTFRGTAATPLAGQGTNSPTVGGLSDAETANSSFLLGYLPTPFSLVNVGDRITFTFEVTFNDRIGMANVGDNFRFALFDLNGEAKVTPDTTATAGTDDTDNFRGYIFGAKAGSGTGSGGSIRERVDMLITGDNAFATTGTNTPTAPSLGTVGGDPVTLVSSINSDGNGPIYFGEMTLTLTASSVDLSGSFIGSNSPTGNSFSASDTTAPFSTTFGAVGFLLGNGLSLDQASFGNVIVVPEPASAALLGLGAASLIGLRRGRR